MRLLFGRKMNSYLSRSLDYDSEDRIINAGFKFKIEPGAAVIDIKTKEGKDELVKMRHSTIEVDGHPFLVTKAVLNKE